MFFVVVNFNPFVPPKHLAVYPLCLRAEDVGAH